MRVRRAEAREDAGPDIADVGIGTRLAPPQEKVADKPAVVAGTIFRDHLVSVRDDGSVRAAPLDPPKPAADFEIHLRDLTLKMGEHGVEVLGTRLLCEKAIPSGAETTPILAPLEHPAFCASCRELRAKRANGSRVEPVMVRGPR